MKDNKVAVNWRDIFMETIRVVDGHKIGGSCIVSGVLPASFLWNNISVWKLTECATTVPL